VIEGRNAKELTDILTKIAPIEQGAGSVDTPILKNNLLNRISNM
jgi:hypothetical protein